MTKLPIWAWAVIGLALFAAAAAIYRRRRPRLANDHEEFIAQLHPVVQNRFRRFLADIERKTPYKVKIWSGHRGYDHAARLKAQLPELARCCPIGGDYHFYGFALDIGLIAPDGTTLGLNTPKATWEKTGIRKLAKRHGLRWGIDFLGYRSPSDDPVHFDWPAYPIGELQKAAIAQFGSIYASGNKGNRIKLEGVKTKSQLEGKKLKSGWGNCSSPQLSDRQLC